MQYTSIIIYKYIYIYIYHFSFENQSINPNTENQILEKSSVRWRVLTNNLRIDFLPVKIPMTTTSGASQSFNGSFIARGHKLTATVDGVASDVSSVILLTLHVTDVTDRR